MEMLLRKLAAMGGAVEAGDGVRVTRPGAPQRRATWRRCRTRGWRPTTSRCSTTVLSVADGVSVVTENLFAGRFRYVDELVRLGATITTEGHHALDPRGRPAHGRAGARDATSAPAAALALAGLVAEGETTVERRSSTSERGYDDFVGTPGRRSARASSGRRDPRRPRRAARGGARRRRAARWRAAAHARRVRRRAASARSRRLAYAAAAPYALGVTGPPGAGKSTLTDRVDRARARSRRRRRARSACSASTRARPSPAGRSWATASACRATRSTPRVYIRSMATRGHLGGLSLAVPDAHPRARRAGFGLGHRRDGRRRPARGRGRRDRRHDGRRHQPRLGRRDAGGQGRAARGGRRLRHQQGRPRRASPRPAATSSRCSTSRRPGGGARRSSPPSRRRARASTGCPTRSSRTATHSAATRAGERGLSRARVELERALAAMLRSRVAGLDGGAAYESRSPRWPRAGPTPTARPRRCSGRA